MTTAAAAWLLSAVDPHGTLLCLLAFLLAVVGATRLCSGGRRRPRPPPGPRGWPVVGNLFQLGAAPHVRLTELSGVYGDVFRLQLGARAAVVVNGWSSVRQALVGQLDDFASRPNFASFAQYADGKSISFQPYTAMFRLHRKLATRGLRALLAGEVAESVVRREAAALVELWTRRGDGDGPVDPAADVTLSVGGVLYSLCFGQHADIRDDADYREFVTETNPSTELFAAGNQVELLPAWIRLFWRRSRRRQFSERMARLVALNARKRREHAATAPGDGEAANMLDILMRATRQVNETERRQVGLTDDHLLSTTIEFISAGTDTSSTTLLWLLLYMAVYPDEQRRIQRDIDDVVSGDGPPTHAECLRIPRAEATIFEVMRLSTIVPFALPHCAVADVTLDGYDIPRDTLVLINLWSVAHDARIWDDVDDFRPERFLTKRADGYVVNRQMAHRFLPFSAGRRRCIGEVLGRMQVLMIFATILHKCTIRLPEGCVPDLSPEFGDLLKPRPYKVCIDAR